MSAGNICVKVTVIDYLTAGESSVNAAALDTSMAFDTVEHRVLIGPGLN
jgi:hypothetical protein